MFYCAGVKEHRKYKINLATSKDLYSWERHPANLVLLDGYDARDPYIFWLADNWVMYYTHSNKFSRASKIRIAPSLNVCHSCPKKETCHACTAAHTYRHCQT